MATVFTDSHDVPSFADLSADFVCARLCPRNCTSESCIEDPDALLHAGATSAAAKSREVFVDFISAAKQGNPAAAMTRLAELGTR